MRVTDDGTGYLNDLFIGGSRIGGQRQSRIDVINPSDESVITTVADPSAEDAFAAVDAAAAALEEWTTTAPRRRSDILRRAFDLPKAGRYVTGVALPVDAGLVNKI